MLWSGHLIVAYDSLQQWHYCKMSRTRIPFRILLDMTRILLDMTQIVLEICHHIYSNNTRGLFSKFKYLWLADWPTLVQIKGANWKAHKKEHYLAQTRQSWYMVLNISTNMFSTVPNVLSRNSDQLIVICPSPFLFSSCLFHILSSPRHIAPSWRTCLL